MSKVIYLDYCATTPMDPIVIESMTNALENDFGNPSSSHFYGWSAHNLLKKARQKIADLIEAPPNNIIFNSGATEGNNTVLNNIVRTYEPQDCHIITSEIEHKCILNFCKYYGEHGYSVSYLPTNSSGAVEIEKLPDLITEKTRLISVMAANNETGVLQNISRACEIAQQYNVLIHVDAAQWIGKLPFSIKEFPVDFLTFSAHKFYGPKGTGVPLRAFPYSYERTPPTAWGRAGKKHTLGNYKLA